MAGPICSPAYQTSSTLFTESIHGMTTGPPVCSTTTVFGLAAATVEIRASPLPSSEMFGRSANSPSR
jgi:hypothetical protein